MWQSDSSSVSEDSRSDEDIVIREEDEDSISNGNSARTAEENLKYAVKEHWDLRDQEPCSLPKAAAKKMKLMQWVQHPTVNTRSVTRRLYSEGCILVRPTPEDAMELREWPAEGMHERPVWPDPRYEIPTPPVSELELTLHHTLHAIFGYVRQRAELAKTFPGSEEEVKLELEHLYELLLDTGLLYCMVSSVSQNDLATYIQSLATETGPEWLQETLEDSR